MMVLTYPNTDRDRWPAEDIAFCRGSGKGLGDFEPEQEVAPRSYAGPLTVGWGYVFGMCVPAMRLHYQDMAKRLQAEFRKVSILAQIVDSEKPR